MLEQLETRALMAGLPYGAMADDTGEFMLGNVAVTVVLMESTQTKPGDDVSTENWTADGIASVKQKVQDGVNWWKSTLDAMPNVRDGLLNFTFDWTYANAPVATSMEPISRPSTDFATWIYDFLTPVGFNQSGNFSTDIRAFNNFQRQQKETDWAFTIFVVNNSNELATGKDGLFAPGGFSKAFAFAGGRFVVSPADRPASTFAHEVGHMFWALDEYSGGGIYGQQRGYYNTQNANAPDGHPDGPIFSQAVSIMTNDPGVTSAYVGRTSSPSSLEMVGWKDTDGDGIFDVLDVPFSLTGSGDYNQTSGLYHFIGNSAVRTLPNKNSSGLQNDITINRIRRVEVSIDGGGWQTLATYDAYQTAIDISFPVPAGNHTITIRTHDTRTGVYSDLFVGNITATGPSPTQTTTSGVSGYAYKDLNGDGSWGTNEPALADLGIEVIDQNGQPVALVKQLDPDAHQQGAVLNQALTQVTLSAVGGDVQNNQVTAGTSELYTVPSGNKVFFVNSLVEGKAVEKWTTSSRVLRVDFAQAVSSVSIKALSTGAVSFGRLEAYDAAGNLLQRTTSGALTSGRSAVLAINRDTTDIAYVLARGHAGKEVVLDDLQWGPRSSATTNSQGAYSLAYLPPGQYRIRAVAPPNHVAVTPTDGVATVNVTSGIGVPNVNFVFQAQGTGNPWFNSSNALDVNGSNSIEPLDALIVINYLNANPGVSSLPAARLPGQGFIDVDNNGLCTPLDALIIINRINSMPSPTIPAFAAPGGLSQEGGSGSAEGEIVSQFVVPANAAEYYALQPLHFSSIAGDDEVHVHDDQDGGDHGSEQHFAVSSLLTGGNAPQVSVVHVSPAPLETSLAASEGAELDRAVPSGSRNFSRRFVANVIRARDSARLRSQVPARAAEVDAKLKRSEFPEVNSELTGARDESLDDAVQAIASDVARNWLTNKFRRARR